MEGLADISSAATPLRYDGATERRAVILRLVQERGFCSSSELSQLLGVSEMTIRRDIDKLSSAGEARSVYGGVSAPVDRDPTRFDDRLTKNASRKWAIAAQAATLVRSGAALALDSGSTVAAIPRHIDHGIDFSVVTHSLAAANELAQHPNASVLLLGGQFDRELSIFVDPDVGRIVDDIRVDILFLGTSSIREGNLYCGNLVEARIKRALAQVADTVVAVCDSSKLQSSGAGMARMFGLDAVDTLITDRWAPVEALDEIDTSGCDVVIAPERGEAD